MPAAVASSSADVDLAARDRALAGLDVVLDPERLTGAIAAALPDAGVLAVAPDYVRYKPGTACLVRCRIATRDGGLEAYVRLQRADAAGKLAKHRSIAQSVPGLQAALFVLPADRRLPVLADLLDGDRRRRILGAALPEDPDLAAAALTSLRWKPERRFVARLDAADGRRALLKAFAGDFGAASRAAKLLGGRLAPRTPRRLGRSRRHRFVVLEWLAGDPLDDLLTAGTADGAWAAGAALAHLHATPPPEIVAVTPSGEARRLRRSAGAIGVLVPRLAADADRIAGRIAERLPADVHPVVGHGDFSADQVLVGEGGVSLLDLDEVALAPRARDLGSFAASLTAKIVAGTLSAAVAAEAQAGLRSGYASAAGRAPDERDVSVATAAALLRLAPEPFRHRVPSWDEQVAELVRYAGRACGR